MCLFLAGLLFAVGCVIDNLTGPSSVILGDTATYAMRIRPVANWSASITPVVMMDIPVGWTVISSTYTGTANGIAISGPGTTVGANPTNCGVLLPAVGAGYQRAFVSATSIPSVLGTDSASISISFRVGGSPGNYTLSFWGGGEAPSGSPRDCQLAPATIAVAAALVPPIPSLGAKGLGVLASALAAAGLFFLRSRA